MEEINKRFGIIEAAIDLPDYEVIDLQITHLRNLSTDKDLHSILQDLESKNFRQALYDMHHYSSTVKDDFFDDDSADATTTVDHSASSTHSPEANLFNAALETGDEDLVVSVDDMLRMTKESAVAPREYAADNHSTIEGSASILDEETFEQSDDPLFALDQFVEPEEELTTSHIDKEKSAVDPESDIVKEEEVGSEFYDEAPLFTEEALSDEDISLFAESEPEPTPELKTESKAEAGETFSMDLFGDEADSLPDEEEMADNEHIHDALEESIPSAVLSAATAYRGTQNSDNQPEAPDTPEHTDDIVAPAAIERTPVKRAWDFKPEEDEKLYKKFAYMDQKFRNMLHQHPQNDELEDGVCAEVKDFIHFVSTNDYSESQVESAIKRYQELKEEGSKAEAAQMLIAAATTESTFAQFMLARELFKGEVLRQNYPESFTQINQLAEDDYPEAICDLGQLYEYGIGIDKNKQHALLLYEEAAEMGVARAQKHFDRLKSASPIGSIKSITSSLWGKKRG